MTPPTQWTTTITALLGIWLLVTPFILETPPVDYLIDVLVGIVILLTAGYNCSRERRGKRLSRRVTVVSGLLGGWLLVAPFLFDASGLRLWNDVIVGIGVTSLAMYNTYAAPYIHDANARTRPEDV